MSVRIERRIFNVDEYHRMSEAGILSEDDRVELMEGEIIKMSPIGSRHAACVKRFNTLLHRKAGQAVIVSIQDPIRLDDYSEPEPDVALLRPRTDFYSQAHPTPNDVILIIEVADTSLEYERTVKLPLYARAGIAEVWLAIVTRDTVEAFSRPLNGAYQEFREAKRGDVLSPAGFPDLLLSVDEILG